MEIDVLRFICIALAAVQIGMTVRIAQQYYNIWRSFGKERRGLLPRHVWLIAIAYTLLVGVAVSENLSRVGEPISWYVPSNLIAFSVGTWALMDMVRFQRKHYSRVIGIKNGD